MQRSNDSIAKLASALAKAQIELVNPKKSLVGTIYPDGAGQEARTFNYASLASGLEIVRKTLGQHEIATLQTTAIDEASQFVKLTTVLAHSSGEWISSDWPVCGVAETASPQRMGMALTYARRHSLFTLVGIAGEDDLDAPDLVAPAQPNSVSPERHKTRNGHLSGAAISSSGDASWTGRSNGIGRQSRIYNEPVKPKILSPEQSIAVRDRLVAELDQLHSTDDAAHWARRSLPEKARLIAADELAVERAFRAKLTTLEAGSNKHGDLPASGGSDRVSDADPIEAEACGVTSHSVGIDKSALALPEPRRLRDRQHIRYVAQQALPHLWPPSIRSPSPALCTTLGARAQGQRRVHCSALPRSPSRAASLRRRDHLVEKDEHRSHTPCPQALAGHASIPDAASRTGPDP